MSFYRGSGKIVKTSNRVRTMNAHSRRRDLLEIQNYRCCWCGNFLALDAATIEHIIPRSLGGNDNFENTAVAHKICNKTRGSNFLQEPHLSFLFDHVRKRLANYHAGIAKQDIAKLGLPISAVRWSSDPTSGDPNG